MTPKSLTAFPRPAAWPDRVCKPSVQGCARSRTDELPLEFRAALCRCLGWLLFKIEHMAGIFQSSFQARHGEDALSYEVHVQPSRENIHAVTRISLTNFCCGAAALRHGEMIGEQKYQPGARLPARNGRFILKSHLLEPDFPAARLRHLSTSAGSDDSAAHSDMRE